jgi:adenylosuccinate synthase
MDAYCHHPQVGREYGTTTGRPRRIGWMDIPALNYVSRINGLTHFNITKLDVLDKLAEIKVLHRVPRHYSARLYTPQAAGSQGAACCVAGGHLVPHQGGAPAAHCTRGP